MNRPIRQPSKTPTRSTVRHWRRKLHFGSGSDVEIWSYKIASDCIVFKGPGGEKYRVRYADFFGEHYDSENRMPFAPSVLKAYVDVVFRKKENWNYADRAGEVSIGGDYVSHEKTRAEELNQINASAALRWREKYTRPLVALMSRETDPISLPDLVALYRAQDTTVEGSLRLSGEHYLREVVDRLASLYTAGKVEQIGSGLGSTFRLKPEYRISETNSGSEG